MKYEMVIGLETHVELSTATKIFCGCTTKFAGEPNAHCCEICTGMPGSLPSLNRAVVEYAATAGLALGGDVREKSVMARKHYVYPDLPKAYQISQFDLPLVSGGGMTLSNGRRINLTRIHIEEDAGKLVHRGANVAVDYNRGGVPLIEIVTEPDFRDASEVLEYMERLQTTLRAVGVSDCRMQEGSMRCDVNLSLRIPGETAYGVRSETKNLNSFTAVADAIRTEYARQSEILGAGGTVEQETRGYDADSGETHSLRSKENSDDYRYFPEPDIVTVRLSPEEIERLRGALPELPDAKLARYVSVLQIPEADAKLLTKYRAVSEYFERAADGIAPKSAANFIITVMFAEIQTEAERENWNPAVSAANLNGLLKLTEAGTISRGTQKRVYGEMSASGKPAADFVTAEDTAQITGDELRALCEKAVAENAKSVADYKSGKEKALKAVVGAVMRETRGRADAVLAEAIILAVIA
ncbi:MAG: Asp-tRNA(Asn)/Glu-tRNA(Gln) amidotransferase subunit GatB [Oscillospiraceae bacterium]|jgi:aspartyl-tRNA(Asn)/glutamyl-tRNA(Gln) amidotransferase subunit B|nr:Asp-tRNA(Asn)/Glu-tRNA(Gln) amidotransferase subunit GatB [Oscillospiraceae bacterium]